jgi:hypothetical protein
VLNTQQGITRMRGRSYPWHGRTVIPTFHPAAILHGGGERSRQFGELRDDFELIRDTLAALERPTEAVRIPEARRPVGDAGAVPEAAPVTEAGPVQEEQLELF